jgi:hypothetical protein
MGIIILASFAITAAIAVVSTPVAFNLMLLFFPLEQVLWSSADFLRSSVSAMRIVNYAIGMITLMSGALALARDTSRWRGSFSVGQVLTIVLYCWTLLSLLWSPGVELALDAISTQLPYWVLFLVLTPMFINDLAELRKAINWAFLLSTGMCAVILLSPEFTQRFGRLGLSVGVGAASSRSSPLALGELGGLCLLFAALSLRRNLVWNLLCLGAASVGTAVAVLSGSRGQLICAIVALAVGFPLTRPMKNWRGYLLGLLGAAVVIPILLAVANTVVQSGSNDMAKRWGSDMSQSDASVRVENSLFLIENYIRSPGHWIQGMGFYWFGASNPYGEPYTHVMFVDMFCEEGIVGGVLITCIVVTCFRSFRKVFQQIGDSATERRAMGTLATMIIYQFLLVNKQGNIAGAFSYFLLMIVPCRLAARADKGLQIMEHEPYDPNWASAGEGTDSAAGGRLGLQGAQA